MSKSLDEKLSGISNAVIEIADKGIPADVGGASIIVKFADGTSLRGA